MDMEQINQFYLDIGVEAESDLVVFQISQMMGCTYMGEYTWQEFERGCIMQQCDTTDKWK